MKIKHYLLLIITLLIIAFCQPLVLLLGGFTLLGGVAAFIYVDLPPDSQDAWETKLTDWLKQARLVLTRPAQPAQQPLSDPRQGNGNGRIVRGRRPALDSDAAPPSS